MLKQLLDIPDTFDPDDRRQRQILNFLLIGFIVIATIDAVISLILKMVLDDHHAIIVFSLSTGSIIIFIGLLLANRSSKIPSWVSGAILIIFLLVTITQIDSPKELYDGRSLMTWVLPIMIGAVIFRPSSVFIITSIICIIMLMFSLYGPNSGANVFAMAELFFIAAISWLGMSIANRAIRDARRHAANNEAILNSIADGVLVLDLQGNLISANPALLRMIPENELDKIIAKPLEKITRWRQKVFSVSISEIPEIGMVAVFRDETRRHETERARDSLLATASHELRTPLTAVMNYLEMLQMLSKMGKINTNEFNEHLERALENLKRLQSLVNNILDQAQIQAGVIQLKREPFNLRSLIEKTHQLLSALMEQKHLSYKLTVAANVPPEISGDATRLHQVLLNLIGNAIKFTSEGGIRVDVSMPVKEKLSIQVADSGPGIPPEQLPDIFEPFRRSSDYAQREQQGAGLGLSIAKEIITRMGGEISVASEPGHGTIFTISLPTVSV